MRRINCIQLSPTSCPISGIYHHEIQHGIHHAACVHGADESRSGEARHTARSEPRFMEIAPGSEGCSNRRIFVGIGPEPCRTRDLAVTRVTNRARLPKPTPCAVAHPAHSAAARMYAPIPEIFDREKEREKTENGSIFSLFFSNPHQFRNFHRTPCGGKGCGQTRRAGSCAMRRPNQLPRRSRPDRLSIAPQAFSRARARSASHVAWCHAMPPRASHRTSPRTSPTYSGDRLRTVE